MRAPAPWKSCLRARGRPLFEAESKSSPSPGVISIYPTCTRVFAPIDYEHYLTRQLQPIADAILLFVNGDFTALPTRQQFLF